MQYIVVTTERMGLWHRLHLVATEVGMNATIACDEAYHRRDISGRNDKLFHKCALHLLSADPSFPSRFQHSVPFQSRFGTVPMSSATSLRACPELASGEECITTCICLNIQPGVCMLFAQRSEVEISVQPAPANHCPKYNSPMQQSRRCGDTLLRDAHPLLARVRAF